MRHTRIHIRPTLRAWLLALTLVAFAVPDAPAQSVTLPDDSTPVRIQVDSGVPGFEALKSAEQPVPAESRREGDGPRGVFGATSTQAQKHPERTARGLFAPADLLPSGPPLYCLYESYLN